MRKYIVIYCMLAVYMVSCKPSELEFKAVIENAPNQAVFLEQVLEDSFVLLDTAVIENGNLAMNGKLDAPSIVRVRFALGKYMLLSSDGHEKITAKATWEKLENAQFEGSEATVELQKLIATIRQVAIDQNTYMAIIHQYSDVTKNDSIVKKAQSAQLDNKIAYLNNIKLYIDSSTYLQNQLMALGLINQVPEKAYVQSTLEKLKKEDPKSIQLDMFIKKYESRTNSKLNEQNNNINKKAKEIIGQTPNGEEIKLSQYKGKYVLVDFWASWCGPCRKENPHVVRIYNEFSDENFTILGISLDEDKSKWIKAIKDDHLVWTHISDLKGWQSIYARDYGVEFIPTNFLINPEGEIISSNLSSEDLEKKLAEIFHKEIK